MRAGGQPPGSAYTGNDFATAMCSVRLVFGVEAGLLQGFWRRRKSRGNPTEVFRALVHGRIRPEQ
jgi:hypothetical protein